MRNETNRDLSFREMNERFFIIGEVLSIQTNEAKDASFLFLLDNEE
jgi:hypothetical protein